MGICVSRSSKAFVLWFVIGKESLPFLIESYSVSELKPTPRKSTKAAKISVYGLSKLGFQMPEQASEGC